MKKKVRSRKSIVRLLCFVLVCTICVALSACGKNRVALFDEIISDIDKIYELTRIEKVSAYNQTYQKLKKFGISIDLYDDIEPSPIDKVFVEEYLETHTKEEFLSKVVKLFVFLREDTNRGGYYDINDDDWHSPDLEACECQPLTTLLKLAFEENGIEIKGVSVDMKGNEGYYTKNPGAEPLPFEESHDGKFYSADGTNRSTQTMTDTGMVEYYGDYAILSVKRYSYQAGYYGWVNGQFIDELPSWEEVKFCELYYKGLCVMRAEKKEELLSSNFGVIEVDGEFYSVAQKTVEAHDAYNRFVDWHSFLDIAKLSMEKEN